MPSGGSPLTDALKRCGGATRGSAARCEPSSSFTYTPRKDVAGPVWGSSQAGPAYTTDSATGDSGVISVRQFRSVCQDSADDERTDTVTFDRALRTRDSVRGAAMLDIGLLHYAWSHLHVRCFAHATCGSRAPPLKKRLGLVSRSQHLANETSENGQCIHTGLEVSERALESPSRCDAAIPDFGSPHGTWSPCSWDLVTETGV